MKKALFAAVAAFAFAGGSALAADLPAKAPTYKAPPPVYYNWSGFYIGAHAGGAWANTNWTTNDHAGGQLETNDQDLSGWVAGGQLGYRWQFGNFVVGVEGTAAASRIDSRDPACGVGTGPLPCTTPVVTVAPGFRQDRFTNITSIYSATGQLGFAAWDRALLYVKGGWAWANMRLENDNTNLGASICPVSVSCAKTSRHADGATVGAGLEYAFTPNVSFGVEYDFFRLRADDVSVTSSGVARTFRDIDADVHQVVGRLNFRFGGPLVARY
jgi:outer membrane immunogenic protein